MLDAKHEVKSLDEVSLALLAQGLVIAEFVKNGSVDMKVVHDKISEECGKDMNIIARAMHFAQQAAGI